jgi:N-acetylglucosamine malate deacetylase 1
MRVLAVSAHPDDETLGAGGTLLKHRARGDDLHWLIATAPAPNAWPDATIRQCANQVADVAAAYAFNTTTCLEQPAAGLEQIPMRDLVDQLIEHVLRIKPDRIYTVGDTDVHSDHSITFTALMLALKPFRVEARVKDIYSYEVLSSTEQAYGWTRQPFVPNTYCDISDHIDAKLSTMSLYTNQLQPDPLPRSEDSIRALARVRGTTIGVQYAEAFRLVRQLLD